MYKFEHDWFSNNIPNLELIFSGYGGKPDLDIIEVGSFEGRSTCWFLDRMPESRLTAIDTWRGGKDHDPANPEINFTNVKNNFKHNTERFGDRIVAIEGLSKDILMHLNMQRKKFDFAYVDGSHTAADVNLDLVLLFPILNIGSVIYCDDYSWGFNAADARKVDNVYDSPKLGIDSFVNTYRNKLSPIWTCTANAAVYIKTSE